MGTNWNIDAGKVGEPAFTGTDQLAASLAALASAMKATTTIDAITLANGSVLKQLFDGSTQGVASLWAFSTTDGSSIVDTTGYFDEVANQLRVGDFVLANTSTGGTVSSGMYMVRSNTGAVVDVANITSFGLANTD